MEELLKKINDISNISNLSKIQIEENITQISNKIKLVDEEININQKTMN